MATGYVCMECMFTGPIEEFQTNNDDENPSPDLFDTGVCPECGVFFENIEDAAFD